MRQKLIDHLTLKGRSDQTIKTYVWWVEKLSRFHGTSPDQLDENQIRGYLLSLHERELAEATINQGINALRCFFGQVLGRPTDALGKSLPRPKKASSLPRAYSEPQIESLLEAARRDLFHYTFLSCLYHTGMRVGEGCELRFTALERSSQRVFVD